MNAPFPVFQNAYQTQGLILSYGLVWGISPILWGGSPLVWR